MIYNNNKQLVKELKKLFLDLNILQKDVCERIGITPQKMSKTLDKKSLGFEDFSTILNAIDYELEINFVPKTSKED